MKCNLSQLLCLTVLVLPAVLFVASPSGSLPIARAEDDIQEDAADEDVDVDGDEAETGDVADAEEEEDDGIPKASPNADTTILFVRPDVAAAPGAMELPAGKLVEFLVGFTNKGSDDFLVESVDASFRYPQDFNYVIQNFSAIGYFRSVKPRQQATISYSFIVADAFAARPFGLQINCAYKDKAGRQFVSAVFNETVNIVEVDEGLDGETFFLYVFLAALCVLVLVAGQQFLAGFGRRKRGRHTTVERGTADNGGVDYDWLPQSALQSSSPKNSPRQSPRQRKGRN
ncbi:translocon-associated protein subunit alpha-like [Amphibalanus amphitrite]|uniref:translocon-associated protein subunit alpha-like n=1 Tax=Amphibalanus amphitrite TaxID=1232801 RepID=UPI001C90DCD7|nr:translocon-associated protein subunit alpha-like [Amphibalanus amphitrite]XP_043229794.1 translocon-associated protein subunit alpha-like [Amphibalanus amphitrite]